LVLKYMSQGRSDVAEASRTEDMETTVGGARVHFFDVPRGVPRATLILGHGAGGGVESWDLQLLADRLPRIGVDVALVEQPWRVAGKKVAGAGVRLDTAFREVVNNLRRSGEGMRKLVIGGRSSGARVACRTAADVGADAVLNLAFPLHQPGRTTPNRADEIAAAAQACPVTILQGERDQFGTPVEVAASVQELDSQALVVSVPWCDHSFKLPKKATLTREEVSLVLVETARRALLYRTGNEGLLFPR
jgi:predicted alpha/beta-hydrolase family hydrolase